MTARERLTQRVRTDLDLIDMVKNELVRLRKHLKQEHTPLNPERRSAVFNALNQLQDGPL